MATQIVPLVTEMPPGLNTAVPAADLPPNEIPAGYGFDLTVDGKVKKGTIATGTSRVQKTNTVSGVPYLWHGHRLWNITNQTASTASNVLTIGALNYDDVYYPPSTRHNKVHFSEDTQTILALLPLEPDALMVTKTTGSYIIRNISDTRGYFQFSDLRQELAAGAANRAIVINNVAYVGNATDGIMSYDNFRVTEVSRKIRPTRATVGALAMTADYERNHLILGSTYVYDAAADKWFNYSSSNFRLTSRTLRNPDFSPFCPIELRFAIEHGDTATGSLQYQVKYEDENWSTEFDVPLPYRVGTYTIVPYSLRDSRECRRFAVRITGLSADKYLRQIDVEAEGIIARPDPSATGDYSS